MQDLSTNSTNKHATFGGVCKTPKYAASMRICLWGAFYDKSLDCRTQCCCWTGLGTYGWRSFPTQSVLLGRVWGGIDSEIMYHSFIYQIAVFFVCFPVIYTSKSQVPFCRPFSSDFCLPHKWRFLRRVHLALNCVGETTAIGSFLKTLPFSA
jgi:hypothetical protein